MAMKSGKGVSMSTVGVDIGDWTYEKRTKSPNSFGPVVFRTWDFGGQQEYYTTHQYFLSRRSLYLVLWRIADGEKGINEIQQWLINIQAGVYCSFLFQSPNTVSSEKKIFLRRD
jgi:GTPase SAR1 family protein